MLDFTPINFIAGCIPTTRNAREAAWHAAVGALDTEAVKLIVTEYKNKTWYLAAPAVAFASYDGAGSSLSAALPGTPGHQGDGAYIAQIADRQVGVVIVSAGTVKSFVGDRDEAEEFARQHGAASIDMALSTPMQWEGYGEALVRESRTIAKLAMNIGALTAISIFALWIGFGAATGWSNARIDKTQADLDRNISVMVATVNANLDNPVRKSLQEIQALSANVLSAKGVIPIYQVKAGQTYWEMVLPQWVNDDYYMQFGDVAVSLLPDGNISVKKGKL